MEISLSGAARLLYPRLTAVVTSLNDNGQLRAAPFSWVNPISFNPPMLEVNIGKDNKGTLPNIKNSKEFVVNVVSEDWAQKAVDCEDVKELDKAGLHTVKSEKIKTPGIAEAKIRLECKLTKILDAGGDHFMVCGEIVHAVCGDVKRDGNRLLPDFEKIRPLLHVSGEEFVGVGKIIKLKRH